MIKIKFIQDTEKCKKGEIKYTSKKNAVIYVEDGFAEYVDKPKIKKQPKKKEIKKETKKVIEKKEIKLNIDFDFKELRTFCERQILPALGHLEQLERSKIRDKIRTKRTIQPLQEYYDELQNEYGGFNFKKVFEVFIDIKNKQDKKEIKDKFEIKEEYFELSNKVFIYLIDKKYGEATELLVEEIKTNNYIYTTRDDEKAEMWIYKEGIYIPQAKTFIKEFCRQVLGKAYTNYLGSMVIAKIETDTYIDTEEFFSNININEICVEDGILNLITKEIREFTPEEIFFNKIPVKFDISKECPNVIKHFENVLKDKEDIKVIQELIGYSLYKNYKIEKAFMFNGYGRNGKSKTLELMKRFVGAENCANIPLKQFETDQYSIGELHNKLLNIGGDISTNTLTDTGHFKGLTGRDMLSAQRKFLNRIHFVNYAKQIFCSNELPITRDTTLAFWERWILLDFPYTFLSQKEINLLPKEERESVKLADEDIVEKLTTKEELSGLLNWALEGLQRLLNKSDFSYSKSTKEVSEMWRRRSNSFEAFCMDCLEGNYDGKIEKSELRKAYSIYCRSHKLKFVSDKMIKITLEITFGVGSEKRTKDNERVYCWEGIKFKDSVQGVQDGYGYSTYREVTNRAIDLQTSGSLATLDTFKGNN